MPKLPLFESIANGSATTRAALWMIAASAGFAAMNGIVRYLTQQIDPLEVAFFRCLFGLLVMLPWVVGHRFAVLQTEQFWLHALRAAIGFGAMAAWFYGLSLMPLAEATALSFTTPLFATIAAVLLLGEVMRMRRWTATLIGFAGAMIIIRPGLADFTLATWLVLLSAGLMACGQTLLKLLLRKDDSTTVVFYMVLLLTPISLIPALMVWTTPTWEQLFWLFMLGAIATVAHQCFARAFAGADATAVLPFDFTRLPFVAAIGFVVFGEVPDLWTWVGAAVIVASSVYIAHRERAITRRGPLPPPQLDAPPAPADQRK